MPTELIKCSKAVWIDTWKRSGRYTPVTVYPSGMVKGPVGQERFTERLSAVGFVRLLKESTKLLTRLGFHRAKM